MTCLAVYNTIGFRWEHLIYKSSQMERHTCWTGNRRLSIKTFWLLLLLLYTMFIFTTSPIRWWY